MDDTISLHIFKTYFLQFQRYKFISQSPEVSHVACLSCIVDMHLTRDTIVSLDNIRSRIF